MNTTPPGMIIKGFKGTDADMCCRGFKYELGKWYEHDGDISMCSSGFHFCPEKAGVYEFYPSSDHRIFSVEAEIVVVENNPGCVNKYVAKRIRLVKEETCVSQKNTGDMNTGDWNTGDINTGDRNTGNMNTGNGNTGNGNTGNRNTGNGNVGDRNSGFFAIGNAPVSFFGRKYHGKKKVTSLPVYSLCEKLSSDAPFDPTPYLVIPFATKKKILALHAAHIAARKKIKEAM